MKIKSCISIILVLVMLSCNLVSAESTFETIKENIQDIANGSDNIIGEGAPYHSIYAQDDFEGSWKSGDINKTHQFITARGMEILHNDKGAHMADYLYAYGETLLEYSDWPDKHELDYLLCYGHFYDPTTGKNYIEELFNTDTENAMDRLLSYSKSAVEKYKSGNRKEAIQELGKALHYLEDVGTPHHAANIPVHYYPFNHALFEKYADDVKKDYIVKSSDKYDGYADESFEDFIFNIVTDMTMNARSYLPYSRDEYENSVANTLPEVQKVVAAYLYRFLLEVEDF